MHHHCLFSLGLFPLQGFIDRSPFTHLWSIVAISSKWASCKLLYELYWSKESLCLTSLLGQVYCLLFFWSPWDMHSCFAVLTALSTPFYTANNLYLWFCCCCCFIPATLTFSKDAWGLWSCLLCLSPEPGIKHLEYWIAQNTACRNSVSWSVCWTCTNICLVFWGALARILLGHLAQKLFGFRNGPHYFSPFR